jgi:hypothetical protein
MRSQDSQPICRLRLLFRFPSSFQTRQNIIAVRNSFRSMRRSNFFDRTAPANARYSEMTTSINDSARVGCDATQPDAARLSLRVNDPRGDRIIIRNASIGRRRADEAPEDGINHAY